VADNPLNINRAYVGGDYGRSATKAAQPFKGIVFHVTGRPTLQSEEDYMSKPDPNRPGYYGYHYLIDRDGSVYQTAPDNVRTNHIMPNSSYGLNNSNALGVAMVAGSGQNGNIITTPEQMQSGKLLADQLTKQYGISAGNVVSHSMLDQATRGPGHGLGASKALGEGDDFISYYGGKPIAAGGGSGGGAGASGSYTPQPSRPGTPTPGAQLRSPFDIVTGVESTGQNVNQRIKDSNYDPATGKGNPARGYLQIIDPTWRTYAPQVGVDINKYPTALDAPKEIQYLVGGAIPVNQWGPDSQAALKKAGYSWTGNETLGQLQSGALNAPPATTTPGTTLNSSPVAAAAPAAAGAAPAPNSLAGGLKSATDAMKPFSGDGDAPKPPQFNLQPAPSAAAAGGPMMLGPGGQNTVGQRLAQQDLAQRMAQWGMSAPPIAGAASFTPTMGMQAPQGQGPMAAPGAATGMPSMPGTTLNSPSELQMAMMTGSLDPYSMYARPPGS
jgi:hypothetical protein